MIPLCVSSHIYMHSYSHSRFHTDCAEALEPGCLDQSLMSSVHCSCLGQAKAKKKKKKVYQQNEKRCNESGRIYTTSPQNHSKNYTLHPQVCNFCAAPNRIVKTMTVLKPFSLSAPQLAQKIPVPLYYLMFKWFKRVQNRVTCLFGFYLLATFIYSRFP